MNDAASTAIKFTDVAIVLATLLGPIFAVQAQRFIDLRREKRQRRLNVFYTLMRTRGSPLAMDHVNALNGVPLEFAGSEGKIAAVRTAWKVYMNHLSKNASDQGWGQKRSELLIDMLQKMGESLNYKFDTVELEKDIYSPIAHGQIEFDQDTIRRGVAALFRGETSLPMVVREFPSDNDTAAHLKSVLTKLDAWLDNQAKQTAPIAGVSDTGLSSTVKQAESPTSSPAQIAARGIRGVE